MVRADKIDKKGFQIKLARTVSFDYFLSLSLSRKKEIGFGENALVCFVCVRSSLYDSVLE